MGKLINTDDIPWDVDGIGFIPVIGKDEIDAMPEAVVRCKECRFNEYHEPGMVWCSNIVGSWVGENCYCSHGERRKDDAIPVEG